VELAFRPNLHTPDHKPNTMGCQAEPALLECAYERTEGQATLHDSLAPASRNTRPRSFIPEEGVSPPWSNGGLSEAHARGDSR
jgi:hypothetical protein